MSPLSILSSENEHIQQEEASYNKTDTTYRSNTNNSSNNNNTVTSGSNSDTRTQTAHSFHIIKTTNTFDKADKEQIGFYFVIFFHSTSPLIHSKNILQDKEKTCKASSSPPSLSSLTTQRKNMTATTTTLNSNHKRNIKSKAQYLFPPFYEGSNCNDLCENDFTQEHVNYFHTLFPAKYEVPHATLESIALPTAFGGSTSELELVLTSLSPSSYTSSHSTSENITDVECSSSQTISSNATHISVNSNEQQQHNKSVPCNCQIHQVHDKNGMLRCTHIILASTFNTVRVMNLAQVESKRVAVALVLTCPPSRSMECAFLSSHMALLKSCLHKLIYFAMRSIYRYFKVLPLFSHRNVIERRLEIDKLYEKLVQCKDAINVRSMIKHDLNNFLHIRFPLPFIGVGGNNTQHVFLPLFWMSDNNSKEQESEPPESSSSVLNESTLLNEINGTTSTEISLNNIQHVNTTVEEENSGAILPRNVGKATPLSSALFEALSYVLLYDASFASAFVISLCEERYHKNKNNDKDDVYQGYWETIKENELERDVCTRSTAETEIVNSKANTLRRDKSENVQIIVECSNDAKLSLSLLIIAVFFWRPELSDTAQPSCFAHSTRCKSSEEFEFSEEQEELLERWVEHALINAIAGLLPQNKNTNETTESTKDNVVINLPIQWVCHSESANNSTNGLNEQSELQEYTKYVTPYCTFDKLYLVNPLKHTCQEVLVERNIMTTVTVDMNVELDISNTNNHKKSSISSSTTHCRVVENPFRCIVKHHKEIIANNGVTNLLHEALQIHKQTDGVVPVTQTLPRMMYWWQTQQKEVPFTQ